MPNDDVTLVIAAHPDDEVLGCGGTAARLARDGERVYLAILGEGMTSRQPSREDIDRRAVDRLHQCSHAVAHLLGARDLFMYGLPDNRFDTLPMLDVVKIIEELVDRLRPTHIYTQHGGDLNVDHGVTFRATLTATRPMAGRSVRGVYAYQVASSTEWSFGQFHPRFQAQKFLDISETLEVKIEAMQRYESEARSFPHPRSPEALRAHAIHLGSRIGVRAAEGFSVVWELA